jgi:hypothetical protein
MEKVKAPIFSNIKSSEEKTVLRPKKKKKTNYNTKATSNNKLFQCKENNN